MSYRDWSTELASFALFRDLPPEVIEQVAVGIRPEQCAASTKLIQADEESRHVFLVRFGSLKVVARPESLNPVVLALLGQGAIIGELGAIQFDHGRSAEVIALEECRLFMMEQSYFQQSFDRFPTIARNLTRILAQRLRRANERIWLREEPKVIRRVAWVLFRLAEEYGEVQADSTVRLPLQFTQQDLANLVGTTRSRVNRQLVALDHAGIIDRDRRRYLICDVVRLKQIADGDDLEPRK